MKPRSFPKGSIIARRFQLQEVVASGGMGSVFRAHDLKRDEQVALKLLFSRHLEASLRFEREVQILQEIHHPGIVRYISHGTHETGQLYLVMEWLEGEDLSQRMAREPLTVRETIELGAAAASALEAAHVRGIIHRDIKPSNLFLTNGRMSGVKLLDFGIARLVGSKTVTRAGTLLGTPDHMAPEQVRSEPNIDGRADLFSLGCVLYQCLVQEHPFASTTVSGVLSKILMEPAPELHAKRPELPPQLCALVHSLLEKERESRPDRAGDVIAALLSIPDAQVTHAERTDRIATPSRQRLTTKEQRLISLVLVSSMRTTPDESSTHNPIAEQVRCALISAMAESFNASCQLLPYGQILIVLMGKSAASDQARQAARLALQIRARFQESAAADEKMGRPPLQLAVSTGCCALHEGEPDFATVAHTADMLRHPAGAEMPPGEAGAIWLDEVTAGLLGDQFQTRTFDGQEQLISEEQLGEPAKWSCHRRTPFYGRDSELRLLLSLLDHCIEEPRASVALITAEAGTGKSRLGQEFVQRALATHSELSIWVGAGDPQRLTVPYGLVARTLRQVMRLPETLDAAEQHAKLRSYLTERLEPGENPRAVETAVEFMGEILGIESPIAPSSELQCARLSTTSLSEQVRRVVIDLLLAECKRRPLLWLLEDMHLADRASLWLIDAALRQLAEQPLCVVGLARPLIHSVFPDLWRNHPRQELKLTGLSRKTSEQIIRAMLGNNSSAETIQQLVESAGGNAFFLEEMVRAAAAGQRSQALPSVLVMIQSRIAQLTVLERRVLRAASIFGSRFRPSATLRLLGDGTDAAAVTDTLHKLTAYQLIKPTLEMRLQHDPEYMFTHSLVRDAAYGLMTANHRAVAHSLASQILQEDEREVELAEPAPAAVPAEVSVNHSGRQLR